MLSVADERGADKAPGILGSNPSALTPTGTAAARD